MKITHSDGSVTDTDKLDDLSAELMERMDGLLNFCVDNKIPIYCKYVNPLKNTNCGFSNFNERADHCLSVLDPIITDISRYLKADIVITKKEEPEDKNEWDS